MRIGQVILAYGRAYSYRAYQVEEDRVLGDGREPAFLELEDAAPPRRRTH
jgi:hypothetical protein